MVQTAHFLTEHIAAKQLDQPRSISILQLSTEQLYTHAAVIDTVVLLCTHRLRTAQHMAPIPLVHAARVSGTCLTA